MIEQKNTQRPLKNFSIVFLSTLFLISSANAKADFSQCKNKELQEKVNQVAKEEGVNPDELLSIIAHESRCNYFVIAWNLPGAPQTAKSKFFENLEEAKSFAEELISIGKYRVDVGIGQINNEANIKRKEWSLEEVLNPKTALNRVAQILKERGWAWYHSSNPFYAQKWRRSALNALDQISSSSSLVTADQKTLERKIRIKASLLVYNSFVSNSSIQVFENMKSSGSKSLLRKKEKSPLLIYENL